jgi:hypothetical protein
MREISREDCSNAQSFCDGYCDGFDIGNELDESDTSAYRAGLARGVAAREIEKSGTDALTQLRESLYEEVSRLERYYGYQGPSPTDQHCEQWRMLQKQVRQIGNESWEAVLLETYHLVGFYSKGTGLSEPERSSVLTIKQGIVERLAKALANRP